MKGVGSLFSLSVCEYKRKVNWMTRPAENDTEAEMTRLVWCGGLPPPPFPSLWSLCLTLYIHNQTLNLKYYFRPMPLIFSPINFYLSAIIIYTGLVLPNHCISFSKPTLKMLKASLRAASGVLTYILLTYARTMEESGEQCTVVFT
jgi:hypothetical protein